MSLYQHERDGNADALLGLLHRGERPAIRERAARILGSLDLDGAEETLVVDGLIRQATDDESPQVRAATIDSLDQLGGGAIERAIAALSGEDNAHSVTESSWAVDRAYRAAMGSDIPELRMAAARGIGRLGDPSSLPLLLAATDDPNPRVRERVVVACGSIGHRGAVPALIERLDDDRTAVRRGAAEALGMIGTRAALRALLDRLTDPNESVRYIAVSGLGAFDTPEPIESLVASVGDGSPVVRRAAIHSIIDLLATAPIHRSHDIRATLADSLVTKDDEAMVRPLLDLIEAGTRIDHRRNAIWLIGHVVGDRFEGRAIDALLGVLDSDDPRTVQIAVASLLEIGGRSVELRLLSFLDDAGISPDARAKAIFVLGKVGSDNALEYLQSISKRTDDEAVRRQASTAIVKLGGGM